MGGSDGGGGSQTTVQQNSYDPESSRRLAAVAERQQDLQEEMMSYYEEVFKPYETESIDIARANLADKGALDSEQIAAQRELLVGQKELEQRATTEQIRDIEANRALRDAAREEQMRETERTSLVADKFYDTALKGVNLAERLDTATTDVQQGFSQAQASTARMAGRYGVNPSASDFKSSGIEEAKAIAGARTLARRTAEQESFQMLQSGMAARGAGVQAVGPVTGGGTVPYGGTSTTTAADRYGIVNPIGAAAQFGANATSGYGALASRVQSSTGTTTTSGGGGIGIAGGVLAGASVGSAFGPYGAAIGGAGGGLLGAMG